MEDYLKLFVDETSWYNDIVLGSLLPEKWWAPLPHFCRGWLRNYIGGTSLYLISGILWCFYIYHLKRNVYIPKDAIPSRKAMLLQIGVAMKAMPWYCALPSISEYMVEHGWTKCFSRISDVGLCAYIGYLTVYLVIVEFGRGGSNSSLTETSAIGLAADGECTGLLCSTGLLLTVCKDLLLRGAGRSNLGGESLLSLLFRAAHSTAFAGKD